MIGINNQHCAKLVERQESLHDSSLSIWPIDSKMEGNFQKELATPVLSREPGAL